MSNYTKIIFNKRFHNITSSRVKYNKKSIVPISELTPFHSGTYITGDFFFSSSSLILDSFSVLHNKQTNNYIIYYNKEI